MLRLILEDCVQTSVFGRSVNSLPIFAHHFGSEGLCVLILAGVHGDEVEGVTAAQGLLESFNHHFPYKLRVTLVPMFNVDGVLSCERKNANGVDLNRNLPSDDWSAEVASERYFPGAGANSEPENQALVEFLEKENPVLVISLHSWKPLLNINGDCLAEAEKLSSLTGYEVKESIGYPTPGCLGTYAGLERDMPTLTYEIERGLSAEKILEIHPPAILQALKITESKKTGVQL